MIYQGDNYHNCVGCRRILIYGDIVTRSKWGYCCQKCSERKNMPNIKITAEVDGKIVPLENISTETFETIKALEKPKEIPVARIGNYKNNPGDRRLFLKLTDSIRINVANKNINVVAINLRGVVNNIWRIENEVDNLKFYENIKPL